MPIHTFLTGDKQVGKSTIIQNFITRPGYEADGFLTYWETKAGVRQLFLSSLDKQEKYLLDDKEVFNTAGVRILEKAGRGNIIVMDELGFLETEALAFQASVLKHLNNPIPILGVIKPARTTFLDAVRAHPNVKIIEVTNENRDTILNWEDFQ
jgi:nucleoside-triphosphatase